MKLPTAAPEFQLHPRTELSISFALLLVPLPGRLVFHF